MNKSKGNIFDLDLVVNQIGMGWLHFILVCTKPSTPSLLQSDSFRAGPDHFHYKHPH